MYNEDGPINHMEMYFIKINSIHHRLIIRVEIFIEMRYMQRL